MENIIQLFKNNRVFASSDFNFFSLSKKDERYLNFEEAIDKVYKGNQLDHTMRVINTQFKVLNYHDMVDLFLSKVGDQSYVDKI